MTYKLSKVEGIFLIVAIMVNQLILNVPNSFIHEVSTGIFLNTVYVATLAVIFAMLVNILFRSFESFDILDVSEYLGGKPLKILIGIAYLAFFVLLVSTLARYMAQALRLIYFPTTPVAFILLFLLAPVVLINKLGLRSIARINIVILPASIGGMILIGLSLWSSLDYNNLFPFARVWTK